MNDDRSGPLPSWIDSLSAAQARKLGELLIRIYIFRKSEAPPEAKYAGRTDLKVLAELLAKSDADWRIRELVLNAGRTLYFSTEPRHPYYREELITLVGKAAKELKQPQSGAAFKKAVEDFSRLADAGGNEALFGAGGILQANLAVVEIASNVVNGILGIHGGDYFSVSEKRMLGGVVDPATAQRLNA